MPCFSAMNVKIPNCFTHTFTLYLTFFSITNVNYLIYFCYLCSGKLINIKYKIYEEVFIVGFCCPCLRQL